MKQLSVFACLALIASAPSPLLAQAAAAQAAGLRPPSPLAPSEIVAAAPVADWVAIAASDLLVMELAPLNGKARRVVIQLIPPPFSQGWVGNIRRLAAARWWDGTSVNRVQDNYVVQWGDASEKKPLPAGLGTVSESEYVSNDISSVGATSLRGVGAAVAGWQNAKAGFDALNGKQAPDPYAERSANVGGWPMATTGGNIWPVHCYGMVGVGRNLSPDTGSGAELYTVIGHAPRHLDRNIALIGRVIEGIEHLSSLPRGTEALGFYKTAEERVPIVSIRLGIEVAGLPRFEYLSTESASFARYADARANRRDAFFNVPAGGADICNIPVPVRRKS